MFIDANGRDIEITESWGDIEALHNGQKIGSIVFNEIETDHHSYVHLYRMDVDSAYQKAGIGVEMMRLAAEIYGKDFSKPSFSAVGGSRADCDEYYTQEGAALIRKCIALGILVDTDKQEIYEDEYDD